jgi:hypothetical protein
LTKIKIFKILDFRVAIFLAHDYSYCLKTRSGSHAPVVKEADKVVTRIEFSLGGMGGRGRELIHLPDPKIDLEPGFFCGKNHGRAVDGEGSAVQREALEMIVNK